MTKPSRHSGPEAAWRRPFIAALAVIIGFAAINKGAHDQWAATFVYGALLTLFVLMVVTFPKWGETLHFPLWIPLGILIAVFILSFRGAVNPSESWIELTDWLAFVLIFYLGANLIQSEEDIRFLFVLLVPIFLAEFYFMFREWLWIRYQVAHKLREYVEPDGTFVNANAAAGFSLAWLAYYAEKVGFGFKKNYADGSDKKVTLRWVWFLGLVSIAFVLAMIWSAWSVLCILFGLGIYFGGSHLSTWVKKNRLLAIGIGGIVLSVVGGILWVKLGTIYGWGGFSPVRSETSRLNWWVGAVHMWRDHPWLGVGLGNFPSAYPAYKMETGFHTLYAHSFIFSFLAETGILGLGALLAFFVAIAVHVNATLHGSRRSLFVGIAMMLMFATIQVSLEYLSHLLVLGLFLGTLVRGAVPARHFRPRLPMKILVSALAIFAIPFFVSPFMSSQFWVGGDLEYEAKNFDAAEESYQAAISLDPRPWQPYWGIAQIRAFQKNWEEAYAFSREAAQRNRLNPNLMRATREYELRMRSAAMNP